MHDDLFWNLLAKKLSGEASEEEIQELAAIIRENPELSYSAQNIADLWKLKPQANKTESEKAFQKLLSSIDCHTSIQTKRPVSLYDLTTKVKMKDKWYRPAILALFMMVTILATVYFFNRHKETNLATTSRSEEVYTSPGTRTRVLLPDSTIVWLNEGSKLSYAKPFGITDRSVTLTGEAFFDVTKNAKPFIIYTNGAQIKVLGTVFNVRSYPSEKKIETSLVHGRVEIVMEKDPENKYVLKPDEKLTLSTEQRHGVTTADQTQKIYAVISTLNHLNNETIAETSWVENKLIFDDETFEELALRMERWYGVTIEFADEKLRKERLNGSFEKENIWQALDALRYSTPFHYQAQKNNVILITL